MKIGILYIGIGRYACFWPDFYQSCEKYLVPEAEKHYYVFTDKDDLTPQERVTVFHQDDMGWPLNSLFRFKMFGRIKDLLQSNDYLLFFNSNALLVAPVTAEDILPRHEDYVAMCMETDPDNMGHESRPASAAYIAKGQAQYYFSGAMNGGKTSAFLTLIDACDRLVDTDLTNGIMPRWHDESVLNRFLLGQSVKVVYREMGKPANWREPRHAKVILRRKEDVLGRNWLRNYKGREHTNTWLRKFLRKVGLVG